MFFATSMMTGKPIAPTVVPKMMGTSIHQSVTCGSRPPGRITKPALLNTEIAMKTASHTAYTGSIPMVRKRGRNMIARNACMLSEVAMTALSSVEIWPIAPVPVSWVASMRWVSPRCRDTAKARIDASVMTPRPPTTMPAAMTACPKGDQYDAVSTVVRPVTHTADTAVKSTSTKGAGSSEAEAMGNMSSTVITPMMRANVLRANLAGE